MSSFDLEMPRGDSRQARIQAKYPFAIPEDEIEEGDPYPLFGKTVWFSAIDPSRPAVYLFQKKTGGEGIDVSGAAPNVALVSIAPEDTASLNRPTVLECDVQVLEAGGKVYTVAEGRIHIKKDITRETS